MDEQSQLRHALTDRDPGDESAFADEPQSIRSLTPSGLELFYSWEPRRHYKIRDTNPDAGLDDREWAECPSVTTVLGVLDKSGALSWWAQGQAAAGIIELFRRGVLKTVDVANTDWALITDAAYSDVYEQDIVKFLVEQKLSINHVKNKAADRGTNVHTVLETWAIDQSFRAEPELYEEHEKGYIVGLNQFFEDISGVGVTDVETEVMVGSLAHGFAGRYDLRVHMEYATELVVKNYPKRKDKVDLVNAGSYLLDLKTSKDCYPTHSLQLAAYEAASIECGYGPTDYRAVIRVSADGKYEFRRSNADFEDFLAVLGAHKAMQRKDWFS